MQYYFNHDMLSRECDRCIDFSPIVEQSWSSIEADRPHHVNEANKASLMKIRVPAKGKTTDPACHNECTISPALTSNLSYYVCPAASLIIARNQLIWPYMN